MPKALSPTPRWRGAVIVAGAIALCAAVPALDPASAIAALSAIGEALSW